jgi:CheY-like chemotaxis protein
MRLELDQNPTTVPFVEKSVPEPSDAALEIRQLLRDGIKAANAGDRRNARTYLLRVTELDPQNENAWLWLASISEFPEELLAFLSRVLDINPENERALEWAAATKSLLAKTFVQRGIDAFEENNAEFAQQCFTQALVYDEENISAWLWMASIADSTDGKINYLEKALSIDPENETALEKLKEARKETTTALLRDAQAAAVAGNIDEAKSLLGAILEEMPESEEAWMLNSHFADSFEEKIHSFEMVLGINPENRTAMMSLESLRSIMASVAPAPVEDEVETAAVPEPAQIDASEIHEPIEARVADIRYFAEEESSHYSPTQELVFPIEAAYLKEANDTAEDVPVEFESADVAEPAEAFQEPAEGFVAEFTERDTSEQIFISADAQDDDDIVEEHLDSEAAEHFASPEKVIAENPAEPSEDFYYYEETPENGSGDENFEPVPAPFEELEAAAVQADSPTHSGIAEAESFDAIPVEVIEEHTFEASPFETHADEYSELVSSLSDEEAAPEVQISEDEGIPMPTGMLEALDNGSAEDIFKTRIVELDSFAAEAEARACPFCSSRNEPQAFICQSCMAMLTLSDLEMLLANQHADKVMVRSAVEKMEKERGERIFSEQELTTLGIGHLNLRNFQFGFDCLQEAARINPNNVVLQGQVNALRIRLEEIKKHEESEVAKPKGKTILVVDDSPTVRKLISGKLEKCGHTVYCAEDGVQAMGELSSMVPDLILLDINMPRMDGYQVCKLIRTNDETKDVPVVMISGKDGFFDKVRGRMAGTSGYITKPFGPETLMKAIETYLKIEEQ